MEVPFVVMNDFVLAEIPDECYIIKGGKNGNEIRLSEDKPNLVDKAFKVLSVGQNVAHIKVGDMVRFDDHGQVNAAKIMGKMYILTQAFDVNIRLKRPDELTDVVQ